ncbi:MAG: hypothetical protein ABSC38_02420 [Verrucomicrobiia bacterium]
MKGIRPIHRRQEGFSLLYVLGFLFLTVIMVESILPLSSNHRKIAQQQVNLESAMYVAEAGLERGAQFVQSNIFTLVYSSTGGANGSGSVGAGTYAYSVTKVSFGVWSIVSTGTVNGVNRVVSIMRVYEPSFAEFALLSCTNGAIYFAAGDVFNGHVHSDTPMYFSTLSGGPIFSNKCSTLTNIWYTQNATLTGNISGVEFDKGFLLNYFNATAAMTNVDYNSTSSDSLKSIAQANDPNLVLYGNTTITFNGGCSTGTVKITNGRQSWTNHLYTPTLTNGIIYVANYGGATSGTNAGIVYLNGGSVTGQLTIVTENDMYIQGNITYIDDPRVDTNSICALGLIAQDDINVATSAPNNLEIDAEMLCTGSSGDGSLGSFGVVNYSSGSPRGILTVFGGIVQETRGAVGTLDSHGNIATGYSKHYAYDTRFLTHPPPYFPYAVGLVYFANWQEGPKQ